MDTTTAVETNLFESLLYLGRAKQAQKYDGTDVKWIYTGGSMLNRIFDAKLDSATAEARIAELIAQYQSWQAPAHGLVGQALLHVAIVDAAQVLGAVDFRECPLVFVVDVHGLL